MNTHFSEYKMENNCFSQKISIFHGRIPPEEGYIVGYGAMINFYKLAVPLPETLSIISIKNRKYQVQGWNVYTPSYQPENTLYKQLVFALKYEGINLLFFKFLFNKLGKKEVIKLLNIEPSGQYSRKIWFLFEWLTGETLPIPDMTFKNFSPLVDDKIQFAISGQRSSRHRIINNLPGTPDFCPLIYKTEKLEKYIASKIQLQNKTYLNSIHKDIMQRASSFLLLKDSRASFKIEGENPGTNRALRWGKAIGEAGKNPLSKAELIRLQGIIIENKRFTKLGFRTEGGFVGDHDRITGEPIPEHISARWQDLDKLMDGLIQTAKFLASQEFDPLLTAALIAFGFVFIHPFSDGNGRIHRYLIHHILAKSGFTQQGVIFPVSASILDKIDEYRIILENYSHPVLELIKWKSTPDHNVRILNETIDYYRYFDATKQAEFLFDCVVDTINRIIPEEVDYILKFDEFKRFIDDQFEMPDKLVASLVRFLRQNNGILSKRARKKEFWRLRDAEVAEIEEVFKEVFKS